MSEQLATFRNTRRTMAWGLLSASVLWASPLEGKAPLQAEEAVRVEARPLLTIGELDGQDEYHFQSVRHAVLLEDGRVVVSDIGLGEIRVFSPDGTFLNDIGGRGEGPGEFGQTSGMWLASDGRIGVWDAENTRLSTFRPDGTLVSEARVTGAAQSGMSGRLEVFLGAFENDDVVLVSVRGGPPALDREVADDWILGRFGLDGSPRGLLAELLGFRRRGRAPLPFTPVPRVVLVADSLYATDGYAAEIGVYGADGAAHRTIELPHVDFSPQEAWSALEAELRRRDEQLFLRSMARLSAPEEFPQVGGLLVDGAGLIWAKVYDPFVDALWLSDPIRPAAGGEWRLVRPSGELVGTARIPAGVTPLHVTRDRLLGVSRDELDVERIVVHRIERP